MTGLPSTSAPALGDRDRIQRRTVLVLSGTQVLGGVGVACGLAVTTLIASAISGSDTIAGLAQTSGVVGAALLSLPVARIAARAGRRPALLVGYGIAAAGAVVAAVAAAIGSWPLLLVALLGVGGGTTAGLAARYAAVDLAAPERRGRDLSVVVWATTVGSVAGPNLAAPTQRLGAAAGFGERAGPYLLAALAFAAAAMLVGIALRPDPLRVDRSTPVATDTGRAAARVRRAAVLTFLRASPDARLALTAVALSHTVMVALMSMTPVHMGHGGASLQVVGVVISLHIAGMYALSPVVGVLADRLGRVPVLAFGAVLLVGAAAVVAGAPPTGTGRLTVGLVLLGLGWSCGLVAGSALLTDVVPTELRPDVQGVSDLAMNVAAACGGALAGVVVAAASYPVLALLGGAVVLPYLALTVVRAAGQRRRLRH